MGVCSVDVQVARVSPYRREKSSVEQYANWEALLGLGLGLSESHFRLVPYHPLYFAITSIVDLTPDMRSNYVLRACFRWFRESVVLIQRLLVLCEVEISIRIEDVRKYWIARVLNDDNLEIAPNWVSK